MGIRVAPARLDSGVQTLDGAAASAQIMSALNASSSTVNVSRLPVLSGDVGGAVSGNSIASIQGQPITATGASAGNVLAWIAGRWQPTDWHCA